MMLYLSDRNQIVGALRRATDDGDPTAHVEFLPHRFLAAAATTGRLIGELAPSAVAVATFLPGETERVGIAYRARAGGDAWVPDVLFDHDAQALTLCTDGEPCSSGERPVSRAAGGAFAAALAVLPPARVVGVAGGAASIDRIVDLATSSAQRALEVVARAEAVRDGDDAVGKSVRLGGAVADRLRLTATQRARFLQAVRSAAVRGGRVPSPIESESDHPSVDKTEAKRRLAELEQRLAEWERAEE
ncbi:MAG: hypothetical protein ACOC2D_00695 [Spirochaetota bacterium]